MKWIKLSSVYVREIELYVVCDSTLIDHHEGLFFLVFFVYWSVTENGGNIIRLSVSILNVTYMLFLNALE